MIDIVLRMRYHDTFVMFGNCMHDRRIKNVTLAHHDHAFMVIIYGGYNLCRNQHRTH